ncbi:MAG TPA: Uma2 family endonuclease [Gemmatimonadota bacterium]|nr:Uma2 family endonuclease [Gemmatimonadota bacterium]
MRTDPSTLDARPLTLAEFERLPDEPGCRMELVRGRVVREPPAGFDHSEIAQRIALMLGRFVRETSAGTVVGADCGFVLFDEPPTVRAPDAAFVSQKRLGFDPKGFAPLAPDLAVEVLSPSNTMSEIHEKVLDYLDAGSRLVWVVDPGPRTVTVYRSRDAIRLLTENDELDGADVLPGFRVKVSDLFGR